MQPIQPARANPKTNPALDFKTIKHSSALAIFPFQKRKK